MYYFVLHADFAVQHGILVIQVKHEECTNHDLCRTSGGREGQDTKLQMTLAYEIQQSLKLICGND